MKYNLTSKQRKFLTYQQDNKTDIWKKIPYTIDWVIRHDGYTDEERGVMNIVMEMYKDGTLKKALYG